MSASNHPIRYYPHPDLKNVEAPGEFPSLSVMLDSLETMDKLKGVAIAANQTGRGGRWWVMRDRDRQDRALCIYDPKVSLNGPFAMVEEGCLSLPNQFSKVRRSESVIVGGWKLYFKESEKWEAFSETWTGHKAQIAQHENDHLNGRVYIDYLSSPERSRIKGNMAKLRKQGRLKP